MPFIKQERRAPLQTGDLKPNQVGDLCFLSYIDMVKTWKEKPSWTTAHTIYRHVLRQANGSGSSDENIAFQLAWQVFFHRYVMPYELEKIEENGDI